MPVRVQKRFYFDRKDVLEGGFLGDLKNVLEEGFLRDRKNVLEGGFLGPAALGLPQGDVGRREGEF